MHPDKKFNKKYDQEEELKIYSPLFINPKSAKKI